MEVIVCGGRDYGDAARVAGILHWLKPTLIIHGAARGADTLAGEWAAANGIPVQEYPAEWQTHGRAAGPIRNGVMLTENPKALIVAFPGGRGTADMVRQARRAKRSVLLIGGGPEIPQRQAA